jgi:hypothetical protein
MRQSDACTTTVRAVPQKAASSGCRPVEAEALVIREGTRVYL